MRLLFLTILLALCCAVAPAARAEDLLPEGSWSLIRPSAEDADHAAVSVADAPGGRPVQRVTIHKAVDPFYRIGITRTIAAGVESGSRLRLRFRARSANAGAMRAVVERNGPPYTGVVTLNLSLTPEWREYTGIGIADAYPPEGLTVRFQVGHAPGVVEITDIRVENLGPDPDLLAARAAIAPEAMQKRIRQSRMGTVRVVVRDRNGKPVRDARVSVEQTRHRFLFGCNIFGLDLSREDEFQKAYRERFAALFNYATLPFYWGSFEPAAGQPHYERLDGMARWCRDNGIVAKGHPLVWQQVYPGWAPKDADTATPLLKKRTEEIVTHYRGRIDIWDVVNEANSATEMADTGVGAWVKRDGPGAVVATALGWARAAGGPRPTLIYNDFNVGDANEALLSDLQKRRALPDVVGLQSHMHGGPWPLERVWLTTNRFARFDRPIHYTELTVISGPQRQIDYKAPNPTDWLTTPEEEARQADYLERFYTLLFSHPSVEAITYWDFSDRGAWLGAPAGLLRRDMTPKPAYERLKKLIRETWWTRSVGGTDGKGRYETRAFLGDYRVTVTDAAGKAITRTVALPKASATAEIVVKLP